MTVTWHFKRCLSYSDQHVHLLDFSQLCFQSWLCYSLYLYSKGFDSNLRESHGDLGLELNGTHLCFLGTPILNELFNLINNTAVQQWPHQLLVFVAPHCDQQRSSSVKVVKNAELPIFLCFLGGWSRLKHISHRECCLWKTFSLHFMSANLNRWWDSHLRIAHPCTGRKQNLLFKRN